MKTCLCPHLRHFSLYEPPLSAVETKEQISNMLIRRLEDRYENTYTAVAETYGLHAW